MNTTINRRRLLQALGGGAVAAMTAPAIVQAQGGRKILITCLEADPATMNSAISTNTQGLMAGSPVYSWLMKLDNNGNLTPDLAKEWSVSEDGKTFIFKLREGVLWHDGKPFTAADAKFTVDAMLSKLQPVGKSAYSNLVSSETPDDHTLVLKFSRPNTPFMSQPFAFGPILPRHVWEGTDFIKNPADKAPIGTGPFKFVSYKIGSQIEYARNDAYFGGKPGFDGLIYRIISDEVSRAAAFENGDIDAIVGNGLPLADISRFAAIKKMKLKKTQIAGPAFLATINLRQPILKKQPVRRALAHAIDRQFIRANIMPDLAHPMLGPLWPASPLYNKALKDYALDLNVANQLLDEAGHPRGADGTRFRLRIMWPNNYPVVARMADVIAENLKAVGIVVQRQPLEDSVVAQTGFVEGNFDIIIGSYVLGPDPDFGTERFYNSNNILPKPYTNNSHYANAEVDALFAAQRLAPTTEERKRIYDQIQEKIWADLPILPILAYDQAALENSEMVTGCYTSWNVRAEDFSKARPS